MRRQRREAQAAADTPQGGTQSRTQRNVRHRSRQRARPAMLTVAIRGPRAAKMRELAGGTGMGLARPLVHMVLAHGVARETVPLRDCPHWRPVPCRETDLQHGFHCQHMSWLLPSLWGLRPQREQRQGRVTSGRRLPPKAGRYCTASSMRR